jgi:high-affinity iron transporter
LPAIPAVQATPCPPPGLPARPPAAQAAANSTNPDGARSKGYSAFVLAFTAVLREGIEAVIFLAGVGSQTGIASIPLAALAGLVVGLAVGLAIYYSGRAIKDLKIFFVISTIILFFIAAGQVGASRAAVLPSVALLQVKLFRAALHALRRPQHPTSRWFA